MQTNFYQYDWADAGAYSLSDTPLLDLAVELSNHITFTFIAATYKQSKNKVFVHERNLYDGKKAVFRDTEKRSARHHSCFAESHLQNQRQKYRQ